MVERSSLYWYDYETSGVHPAWDRPMQFAGLRTDEQLVPLEEPVVLYCQLATDILPDPRACLMTGITPEQCQRDGQPEHRFAAAIQAQLARPGTCSVGYNSMSFDHEFSRHLMYRNFYNPYAHEWQHECSRWDLIDLMRLAYALRPHVLNWPRREDGSPIFALEELGRANGLDLDYHDALADVQATVELARRVRQAEPTMFDYAFKLRRTRAVRALLTRHRDQPLLHLDRRYPARQGCAALILPLLENPWLKNEWLVYNLEVDPGWLLAGSDEELQASLPLGGGDRQVEGPPPLEWLRLNRSPLLVHGAGRMLDEATATRLGMAREQCLDHHRHFPDLPRVRARLAALLEQLPPRTFSAVAEVEGQLYSGGLFSDRDLSLMEKVRGTPPGQLGTTRFSFEDPRLETLLFHYRARNFHATLSEEEKQRWQQESAARLTEPGESGGPRMEAYFEQIERLLDSGQLMEEQRRLLEELQAYGDKVVADPGGPW